MDKIETITSYNTRSTKKIKRNAIHINTYFTKKNIILNLIGFMLSRISIFTGMAPFGFAYYAALFEGKLESALPVIGILIGMFTASIGFMSFKYIASAMMFTAFYMFFKTKLLNKTFIPAFVGSACIFITGIVPVIKEGLLLYDLFMLLFESFICFLMIFIFKIGLPIIVENQRRRVLTNEEMISFSILLGLIIMGFGNINFPGGILIRSMLSVLVILIFALKSTVGIATCTGVTLGLINSLPSPNLSVVIGIYGFCGLVSGLFKNFGKIGVSLGFILANAILTIYINGSTEVLISIYDILLAVAIFAFIPKKALAYVGEFLSKNPQKFVSQEIYSEKIKKIVFDKLNNISKSFTKLADTFGNIADKKLVVNNEDIADLFDEVAERVCKDCGLCLCCWEREFHNTYQVMFKILEKLEKKGRIEEKDVPEYFAKRCLRLNTFVYTINNIFEVYKINLLWSNKIGESRALVSDQLKSVSRIINSFAKEITMDLQFDDELEKQITIELDKVGITAKEITVLKNAGGKYEIDAVLKPCGGARRCVKSAARVISSIIGREMVKVHSDCAYKNRNSRCLVRYIEKEIFHVSIGIARLNKEGQAESGDNYSFMQLKDGKYALALSDGMGSGRKASKESCATISLLEQFLDCGFDKETAVKLINSVLILKSAEESFSTIDLSIIDLYAGNVEFVKIGCAPTYIKRQDTIDVVKSTSLPIGILKNLDIEFSSKRVNDGDFIVMITDGILDSKKSIAKNEDWVEMTLNDINSTNPQEIANTLLDTAAKNDNNYINDDMTVLVAKLWKKI